MIKFITRVQAKDLCKKAGIDFRKKFENQDKKAVKKLKSIAEKMGYWRNKPAFKKAYSDEKFFKAMETTMDSKKFKNRNK